MQSENLIIKMMKDTQDSASEAPQAEPCTVELFKKNAMEIKEAAEHIDFQTDAEKNVQKIQYAY